MRSKFSLVIFMFACTLAHAREPIPSAVANDPPISKTNAASMDAFQIASHDGELNAIAYVPSGSFPHPAMVLLAGFPGNERNLDLAQAIRRQGWTVIAFNYRGAWGSPGGFSFTHAIEDAETAIAWLRIPENAKRLRVDPSRIVLAGHSMGGMIATIVGARDPKLLGVGLISAADMAGHLLPAVQSGKTEAVVPTVAAKLAEQDIYPLSGCTTESLARELLANAAAWSIYGQADGLAAHPLLVISSDDGLASVSDALVERVQSLPNAKSVSARHFSTDHAYSDHRIAMEAAFINWLNTLVKPS